MDTTLTWSLLCPSSVALTTTTHVRSDGVPFWLRCGFLSPPLTQTFACAPLPLAEIAGSDPSDAAEQCIVGVGEIPQLTCPTASCLERRTEKILFAQKFCSGLCV